MIWVHRLSDSFRYRDYRLLWTGSMLTHMTFRMQDVILGWQMYQLSDSAFWVGIVAFAQGLPLLIWSPLTGVLADRMNRRSLVAVALIFAAASVAGLTVLTVSGHVEPWQVAAVSFLTGSAFTLYSPARLSMIPNVVPADLLVNASTVEYSGSRLMGFVGPVLAGTILESLGTAWSLATEALLFLVATVVFVRIGTGASVPAPREGERVSVLRALRQVEDYVQADKPLLAVMVLALVIVPVGMSYPKLMPVFAETVLGGGALVLGWIVGVFSLGTALAGFGIAVYRGRLGMGLAQLWSSAIMGIGLVLLALVRQPGVALAVSLGLGLIAGIYLTVANVIFQSRPPDELRGRVISAWSMVWGLAPFVNLATGALAESWGVIAVIALSGVICALFALGMVVRAPQLREL